MGVKHSVGQVASVPKDALVGYWRGLTYPFRGMAFVYFKHPGLIRIWIFPILITLAAMAVVFTGVWQYHDAFVESWWTEPQGEGFWIGVLEVLHSVVEVLVAVVGLLIGLVLVVLLSSVVAAPFNDALSENVERLRTGAGGPPTTLKGVARDLVRTVGLEVLKLAVWAAVMIPLLIASWLVPGVGQVVYTIFGFLFTALYFAVDYIDWPAARRNRGVGHRVGLLREHFLPMFGYGTGVWLLLFIPLVNLLFMPAAVAGGTLLYLDLEAPEDESPPGGERSPSSTVQGQIAAS